MAEKKARIEVSFDNNEVKERLTKRAKQLGYTTREAYLQEMLTRIAYEEYEADVAVLYRQSLDRLVQAVQPIYDALMLNVQLGLMQLPIELEEMEDNHDERKGKREN